MTKPTIDFRRQLQGHKAKGTGSALGYDGAYTGELFAKGNIGGGVTDSVVVAAVPNKKIRVISYALNARVTGVTTATFNSKGSGAGTAISPLISLATSAGFKESSNNGLFETNLGEGLTVDSGTNNLSFRVSYILVD